MSDCDIKKPFTEDAEAVLARVKAAAKKENANFEGTASSGTFAAQTGAGEVQGRYTVQGTTLRVEITKKPWVASCSAVSDKLDSFLSCPTCARKSE